MDNLEEKKKVCFKCNQMLPLSSFYVHKKMGDGHLNKCIICNKKDVRENYLKKTEDPIWIEKERIRGREKFKRLKYKNRHENVRGTRKKMIKNGYEFKEKHIPHHWNYNLPNSVFVMHEKAHKLLHGELKYNEDLKLFYGNDILLDTARKHYDFIIDKFDRELVNYEIDYYNF